MSSGYSSLSTTLSLKTNAVTQPDDAKSRFRKVSLVSESKLADSSGLTAINDYKWRNRLEGVTQYRPLSDTLNTTGHTAVKFINLNEKAAIYLELCTQNLNGISAVLRSYSGFLQLREQILKQFSTSLFIVYILSNSSVGRAVLLLTGRLAVYIPAPQLNVVLVTLYNFAQLSPSVYLHWCVNKWVSSFLH